LALFTQLRNQFRNLFRIRRDRTVVPRLGRKPPVGARIVRDDVRMTVQAGMSDALWQWLGAQGWREVTFRPDRRNYREVPHAYVTRLIDASPDDHERILAAAVADAAYRPAAQRSGRPPALPEQRDAE
jgi:hypothetical protein